MKKIVVVGLDQPGQVDVFRDNGRAALKTASPNARVVGVGREGFLREIAQYTQEPRFLSRCLMLHVLGAVLAGFAVCDPGLAKSARLRRCRGLRTGFGRRG